MIDRVPVPTDNLYKFYALFSLATLIFSLWGLLYLQRSTNDLLFDAVPRIEALKSEPSRSAEQNASLVILQGFVAQVEKSRYDPYPRRSYATAGTATVVGHPSCVNRLSKATRTCNSVT